VDDLNLIAKALNTNKKGLLKKDIYIQMKSFRVRWDATLTGYIQATYKILDRATNEEIFLEGNVIGQKGLTGSTLGGEITFEEGEYIKRLTAAYEPLTGVTSNINVITSLNQEFSAAPVQLVSLVKIELTNVACLTGRRGLLCCGGLGA